MIKGAPINRILLSLVLALLFAFGLNYAEEADSDLSLWHIRNATSKFTSGETLFLIDPMFAKVGAYDGFPDT